MTRHPLVTTRTAVLRIPSARPLGAATLTLVLAAALGLTGAPAQASNSGVEGCLMAYNYSDPQSDYLYASSQSGTIDCQYVYVDIKNGGGAPLAWSEGYGSTSTSVVLSSGSWDNPYSFHTGAYHYGWMDYWLFLDFVY